MPARRSFKPLLLSPEKYYNYVNCQSIIDSCGVSSQFAHFLTVVEFSGGVCKNYISSPVCFTVNMSGSGKSEKFLVPEYDPGSSYENFKNELTLWSKVTSMEKKKQGGAIVLALPNTEKCSLRSTMLSKFTTEELTADDSFTKVVKESDLLLGKDDLEEALSK